MPVFIIPTGDANNFVAFFEQKKGMTDIYINELVQLCLSNFLSALSFHVLLTFLLFI